MYGKERGRAQGLAGVEARCPLCGFDCRGVSSEGTVVAYPDRDAWKRACLHRTEASTPRECPAFANSLTTAARAIRSG